MRERVFGPLARIQGRTVVGYLSALMRQFSLPALPIAEALPPLMDALAGRNRVLLEAPPGAGKSTIVPLALLDSAWLAGERY